MKRIVINVGVVLNKNGEVLIKKRRKPEKGEDNSKLTWVFPGGKQEPGETRKERIKKKRCYQKPAIWLNRSNKFPSGSIRNCQ
jgi:ADP-ribose pyrophosphatase YjhB (NUDIX family)